MYKRTFFTALASLQENGSDKCNVIKVVKLILNFHNFMCCKYCSIIRWTGTRKKLVVIP